MTKFRELIYKAIQQRVDGNPVALLFSGGTDSLIVLWSLLALGIETHCYTFRLENVESKDSLIASKICRAWDVPFNLVIIPEGPVDILESNLRELIQIIRSSRKTHVECSFPFWYLVPYIAETQVWSGFNGDDLWGSAKNIVIECSKDRAKFRAVREKLIADPLTSAWQCVETICKVNDKQLLSVYRDREVIDYLLSFSWEELNKPRQKILAYEAFYKEFERVPNIWRRNDNLQCGSGLREYLARTGNVRVVYKALFDQEKGQNKLI